MRKIGVIMAAAAFLWSALAAGAQQIRTIEIGQLSTTHILFTSDLTYVDISSNDVIAAKVVDASKNMLAIKARTEFAFRTTVSALEANGTMHTFYVVYNSSPKELVIDTRQSETAVSQQQVNTQVRPEQQSAQPAPQENGRKGGISSGGKRKKQAQAPVSGVSVTTSQTSNFGRADAPTLEEVMRKGQSLYHIADKNYHVEAYCVNVYAYSDLTYIILEMENRSDIGYEAGDAQFTVESRKRNAKTLTTDKSVWPKSSYGTLSCAPGARTKVGYTIPKLTLQKDEVLKVYIYEKGGNRNLFLTLDDKDINYAVSPVN